MADCRLDEVYAALLAGLPAATGLPSSSVYDCIEATAARSDDIIIVGFTLGEDGGAQQSGEYRQDWHELGPAAKRDEFGTIPITIRAQTGGNDLAGRRTRLGVLVAGVETLTRGATLGVADLLWMHITAGRLVQGRNKRGVYAAKTLTLTYQALV